MNKLEWVRAKRSLLNKVDMYDAMLSEHKGGRRLGAEERGRGNESQENHIDDQETSCRRRRTTGKLRCGTTWREERRA
eukprot:12846846-Heterocapsa_arctica.AAC.1